MKKPTHDYVAHKSCGCVVAIRYDMADKDTANALADWVKSGYTVDRMPLHDAVEAIKRKCEHEPLPKLNALDILYSQLELDWHAHP